MEELKNKIVLFCTSDYGVIIAWICTVLSFIIAICEYCKAKKASSQLITVKKENVELNKQIINLSSNEVNQDGKKNIYTNSNNGQMNINM